MSSKGPPGLDCTRSDYPSGLKLGFSDKLSSSMTAKCFNQENSTIRGANY